MYKIDGSTVVLPGVAVVIADSFVDAAGRAVTFQRAIPLDEASLKTMAAAYEIRKAEASASRRAAQPATTETVAAPAPEKA